MARSLAFLCTLTVVPAAAGGLRGAADKAQSNNANVTADMFPNGAFWRNYGSPLVQAKSIDNSTVYDLVTALRGLGFPNGAFWRNRGSPLVQAEGFPNGAFWRNRGSPLLQAQSNGTNVTADMFPNGAFWRNWGSPLVKAAGVKESSVRDLVTALRDLSFPNGDFWRNRGSSLVQANGVNNSSVDKLMHALRDLSFPNGDFWRNYGSPLVQAEAFPNGDFWRNYGSPLVQAESNSSKVTADALDGKQTAERPSLRGAARGATVTAQGSDTFETEAGIGSQELGDVRR